MNRKTVRILIALLAACALGASPARAQTLLFDYVGFDYEHPDLNPAVFGDIGDVYQGVGEVPVLFTPLVSDHSTYQYTYHFDGLTAAVRSTVAQFVIIDYTGPGTLTIYEDPILGGTAADYGTNPPSGQAPPTFVDGTAILVGKLTNFRYLFNTTNNTGSFEADFEAIGGTQLGNFPLNNRLGWTFAGVTGNSVTIPSGYDHQVDGQTFLQPPTSSRTGSWGGIKARYR
jgi:hypothetical protein